MYFGDVRQFSATKLATFLETNVVIINFAQIVVFTCTCKTAIFSTKISLKNLWPSCPLTIELKAIKFVALSPGLFFRSNRVGQ
jgi:hypothetical protein